MHHTFRPGQAVSRAFTLVELLVVVSIIALLISILLPSLRKAREQARETVCASNLAAMGKGFYTYAGFNNDFLCSGSVDPDVANGRDGPADQVGWMADLVNAKLFFPATGSCPSNEAVGNQKLGKGSSSAGGPTGYYSAQQELDLTRRGYNSNYTQSWYMARSEARWPNPWNDSNWKRIRATVGPMTVTRMLRVSASRVPLLGDGGIEGSDTTHTGGLVVKSMTDGPFGGPPFAIQDYSDFGPAHGFGKRVFDGQRSNDRVRANILFGDAHVDRFVDQVRNGQFALTRPTAQAPRRAQEDLNQEVFDGVLSLGRRARDDWELR